MQHGAQLTALREVQVAQAGLKFVITCLRLPEWWDCRHVLPYPVTVGNPSWGWGAPPCAMPTPKAPTKPAGTFRQGPYREH